MKTDIGVELLRNVLKQEFDEEYYDLYLKRLEEFKEMMSECTFEGAEIATALAMMETLHTMED